MHIYFGILQLLMFRILSKPLSSFTYSSLISQKMYSNYIHFLLNRAKSKFEMKNLDTVNTLKDKGLIIIKNFLKEERFNKLLNEISKIDDLEEIHGEGFNFRKRQLSHFLPELFPEFNIEFIHHNTENTMLVKINK